MNHAQTDINDTQPRLNIYDNYSNNASLLFPLLLKLMALDNKRANKCKGVLFFVFVKHRF